MKRILVLALGLMVLCGCLGGALAEQPRALLVAFVEDGAGDSMAFDCIGALNGGAFEGLEAAQLALDGQPLTDALREQWATSETRNMAVSSALLKPGDALRLYTGAGDIGGARVAELTYGHSEASGDDYLSATLTLDQALTTDADLVFALGGDAPIAPMEMQSAISAAACSYSLDIDGDGVKEAILWDRVAPALDDEGSMHPVEILRDGVVIQTLEFFYDNDYTTPLIPMLLDLSGDGLPELVLAGVGHNSYVQIHQWQNGEYTQADAGYYSGD